MTPSASGPIPQDGCILQDVLGAIPAGVWVHDADDRLLLANDRLYEMLGLPVGCFPPGSTLDANIAVVTHHGALVLGEDPGHRLREAMQAACEEQVRHRFRRADGHAFELARQKMPAGGTITTLIASTASVLQREQAERTAANLLQVVSNLHAGLAVFDRHDRLSLHNWRFAELLAISPAGLTQGTAYVEVMRLALANMDRPDDGEADGPRDPHTLPTDPGQRCRVRGRVLELSRNRMVGGGFAVAVSDVTAQAAAQSAQHRAAGDMAAMLANVRDGIILWDGDSRIVAFNPVAETLLQTAPGFLRAGLKLIELIRDAQARGNLGAGADQTTRSAVLATQDRSRPHYDRRFTQHGQVLDVQSNPVAGGGFMTTYRDVTEVHRAEQELKDAKVAADAANEAKSRFLAAVSHELRTPLNQVIGFSEGLLRMAQDAETGRYTRPGPMLDGPAVRHPDFLQPEAVADYADLALTAGRQLLGMIDNILDVARLEAGRFDLNSDRVALPRLVQACMRQAAGPAAAGEIVVVGDLPHDLPSLHADERRVRQALMHLLTNAIKFTGAPGHVRITAGLPDAAGWLRLDVSDSGIGIAAADLRLLSEPFIQVDAGLSRRYGGAGLGLYITRAIMSAHGGSLAIASTPGAGTTASLIFPPERVLRPSQLPPHIPSPTQELP